MAAKLAEIIDIGAILACLPIIATVLKAGLMGGALVIVPAGCDLEGAGTLFNQAIANTPAEAAAIAEDVNGFDDAGFTSTVFTQ